MSYNLLEEKWIPVLYRDGKADRVGICTALEDVSKIRCITLASPLDLFAVHRFILTLLYWKASLAGGVEQVRNSLLKDGEIPSAALDGIKKEASCFDLFDGESPFLQDPSVCNVKEKDKKSVGSLFAEFASGSNIAHFHHGDDEDMRLCLPCVTLGMLRVVPWTQASGRGLTPSVHGAPPIMAIAIGDNLAVTLGLNLVPLDGEAGEAKWSGHFKPTNTIPYLEALTWNPRRIFLPPPQKGACWYCGSSDVLTVGKIVYKNNENTKKRSDKKPFEWQDPAAYYVKDFKTINSADEEEAKSGSDIQRIVDMPRPNKRGDIAPKVVSKNPGHKGWLLVVPCTDRAKTFDHRQLELTNLPSETSSAVLPAAAQSSSGQCRDGWKEPERNGIRDGIKRFVQAAVRLLTYTDWAALSNAAYREMNYSPAAFDVFSGLYWGLRDKKINGLPSRNAAWLMLKLMAVVPAGVRVIHSDAKFCPLQSLPKRQINESGKSPPYPVSFPLGPRLEAALRAALDSNMRKRHPVPVDWIGLCHGLDQLLD
ncbi:MAG: type I-E CRISPR-associated protein Cse1/CasA [Deltaproteobacteria bacterium]|nr:type I-E CRISPR-associated protein Cse1/CasA [Deltaproteobacteria bacterium]